MNKNIINQILEKSEHIDFAFEIESKIELLKTAIMDKFRIPLVKQLKSEDWIVFENLEFGKANEYLVFFKQDWKIQFVLYFERPFSDLRIGINPQFQTDIDIESDSILRAKLSVLPSLEFPQNKYWIWLTNLDFSNLLWSEIYEGKLTEITKKKIDEIFYSIGNQLSAS